MQGDEALLNREALGVVVAAMSMENVLARLTEGALVVVPGDRTEVLLGVLDRPSSRDLPVARRASCSTAASSSRRPIDRLLEGLESGIPIITTELGTYPTAQRIANTRGRLTPSSQRKIDTALALFEQHVDADVLLARGRRRRVRPR